MALCCEEQVICQKQLETGEAAAAGDEADGMQERSLPSLPSRQNLRPVSLHRPHQPPAPPGPGNVLACHGACKSWKASLSLESHYPEQRLA